MNSLITNELISDPKNIFFKSYLFIKSPTIYINYIRSQKMTDWQKMGLVVKTIVNYFIISIVTSLYIYGTIIAAPAVIIIFLKCSNYIRNNNLNDVYKIFPWIGIHSLVRETSSNPIIAHSSQHICKAIVFYFFFLYLIYYALIIHIANGLFYKNTQLGI